MSLLRKIRVRGKAMAFDVLSAAGFGGRFLRERPGGRILVWHGLDDRGGSGFNARPSSRPRSRLSPTSPVASGSRK